MRYFIGLRILQVVEVEVAMTDALRTPDER